FRALIVLTITRRVAAGWLVLPFSGRKNNLDHRPQTENAPNVIWGNSCRKILIRVEWGRFELDSKLLRLPIEPIIT
ncbi:MAG: hypothetical protein LBG58_14640, partial [Planctomycetaceae bacterium]|nr:hypothetical protein [Planctomycetaceae bacterium]